AVEIEDVAMNVIGSRLGGDGHVRATVSAEFRSRVVSNNAKLLSVIRIQAVNVALRIRDGRLIGVDTVNGQIVSAVTRSKYVGTGTRAVRGPLGESRLQCNQRKRIAAVEWKGDGFLLSDNVADHCVGGFNTLLR